MPQIRYCNKCEQEIPFGRVGTSHQSHCRKNKISGAKRNGPRKGHLLDQRQRSIEKIRRSLSIQRHLSITTQGSPKIQPQLSLRRASTGLTLRASINGQQPSIGAHPPQGTRPSPSSGAEVDMNLNERPVDTPVASPQRPVESPVQNIPVSQVQDTPVNGSLREQPSGVGVHALQATPPLPEEPMPVDGDAPANNASQDLPPYRDLLPTIGSHLEPDVEGGITLDSPVFRTKEDVFRLYKVYPFGRPSYSPDDSLALGHLADGATLESKKVRFTKPDEPDDGSSESGSSDSCSLPAYLKTATTIFPNESIRIWMEHFLTRPSNTSSKQAADDLLNNVIKNPAWKKEDMATFRMDLGLKAIDEYEVKAQLRDNWESKSVTIPVPCEGFYSPEEGPDANLYTVSDIMVRPILEVIRSAFAGPTGEFMHIAPFEEWRNFEDPTISPERQYHEMYASDAFLEAHRECVEIVESREQTQKLEIVVAALMLGSDTTQLSQFGRKDLWPVYLTFGNISKYFRGKPSSRCMEHIAYLPKLPDEFQDWYNETFDQSATDNVEAHMHRELFHAIWLVMLDDKLMHAYLYGEEMEFWDKVVRLVFPRFFTYSLDYLEKIMVACIKNLSSCPCPRCLASKSKVNMLGTAKDMSDRVRFARQDNITTQKAIKAARKAIYEEGASFASGDVTRKLGPKSLVPTRSAFSIRLAETGFNHYDMLAPDLLHESELGVIQATLIHVNRVIHAKRSKLGLQTLNERYRLFPPFGRDTIRRFNDNVSKTTKKAARDYEDMLQCAIPAYAGLLADEAENDLLMDLLFELATWHALAKLRRHGDVSIVDLEASTRRLGILLRRFYDEICENTDTRELPSNEVARLGPQRKRRKGKKKIFNLFTYKIHALGHYPEFIRKMGTSDSFSSQHNELEHKSATLLAGRAQKGKKQYVRSIAKQQRRRETAFKAKRAHQYHEVLKKRRYNARAPWLPANYTEKLPFTPPHVHHHMSLQVEPYNRIDLRKWLPSLKGDPAVKNFVPDLKTHILARLLGRLHEGDSVVFTTIELEQVIICNHLIYRHLVLRVNYTTYDLRRAQDSINPNGQANIQILARRGVSVPGGVEHPYWYARVIGVFHCVVKHRGPLSKTHEAQTIQFLWVRWYGLDEEGALNTFQSKRLPQMGFLEPGYDTAPAFGFVDPSEVIRAVHLLPNVQEGKSDTGLPDTFVRQDKDGLDWNYFYLNIFADRDMFMRYRGGGAGHEAIRAAVDRFLPDRDEVDAQCRREHEEKIQKQAASDEEQSHSDSDMSGIAERLQDEQDRDRWESAGNPKDISDNEEDFGYRRPVSDDTYIPSSVWGSDGGGVDEERSGSEMDDEDDVGNLGLGDF
ncbi:hypothetical protein NMY22_g10174 [Coprinellus aureogranulatus]|nr:hypothetical protein NMY22_g10174 [Coprinellus aureogranulatus]